MWSAPELLDGTSTEYGCAADVYSFAIVIFEVLTLRQPWAHLKPSSASKEVFTLEVNRGGKGGWHHACRGVRRVGRGMRVTMQERGAWGCGSDWQMLQLRPENPC